MVELTEFSFKEAIELIMGFYTDRGGFWESELEKYPEVRRFVEMGLTNIDEEYNDRHIILPKGKEYLDEYIRDICEKFIAHSKRKGCELSYSDTYEWFKETFKLDTLEDGKDIAEII